jgi:GMP synthase-like glutamine amidotransferase
MSPLTPTPDLYIAHPTIKIFGSCFGHQLFCHAIFSTSSTTVVARDPAGWELGIHPINLSLPFISQYGPVLSNASFPSQLRLQFVHADHVALSASQMKEEGFESIGRSEHCALQGVWKRGRVLTYQGHAEFDGFVNGETLKVFGKPIWSAQRLGEALKSVDGDDDAVWRRVLC